MFDPNDILLQEVNDTFEKKEDANKNTGYVEAEYTSSGVVVLRATEKKEKNIDIRTIIKLI